MELTELRNKIVTAFSGTEEELTEVLTLVDQDEALNNPLYSKGQHRGNKGNEGQLHVNDVNIDLGKKKRQINKQQGRRLLDISFGR